MDGPVALPPGMLSGQPQAPEAKTRKQIEQTAQKFESAFIAQMLAPMFEGSELSGPFGGGPGEAAFKSFLLEAVAQQMSKAGGLGLTDDLAREMLKMQGLEE
ncbi:MAG TPA: rod-binding protein [Caulobacteraceae bacterium]